MQSGDYKNTNMNSATHKRTNAELSSPNHKDNPTKRLIKSPEVLGTMPRSPTMPPFANMEYSEEDIKHELGDSASEETLKLATFMYKMQKNSQDGVHTSLEYFNDSQARILSLVTGMQKQIDVLKAENNSLKCKLDDQENYSRRNNLIIRGIPEGNWQNVEEIVRDFIGDMFRIFDIPLERLHRLGKYNPHRPRPIIVKFTFHKDREAIWDARMNLAHTKFFLDEDFSPMVQSVRRKLFPVLAEAKRNGYKGHLVKDKLKLGNAMYGIDDLHKLPKQIRDGSRWTENNVFFFGELCPASNFHPAVFTHEGVRYENSEKMLFHKMAKKFNDDETAVKILGETDPRIIKNISKEIRNVDRGEWCNSIKELVTPGLVDKFDQNPQLLKWLESTGNRMLVEAAGPYDTIWGNGLRLSSKDLTKYSMWTGQNKQGEMLEEVKRVLLQNRKDRGVTPSTNINEEQNRECNMEDDSFAAPSQIPTTQPFSTVTINKEDDEQEIPLMS